jgi:hypothetical protein
LTKTPVSQTIVIGQYMTFGLIESRTDNRKRPNMKTSLLLLGAICAACTLSACGPGPYGFSRYYTPTKEEAPFDETSLEFTYGAVAARPQDYEGRLIGWFGIVESVKPAEDGRFLVRMAFHKHKERHLCEGETESTCRVTVNHKATGGFTAILALRPEDQMASLDKVQNGTLIRVFGKLRCNKDANGNPKCEYDEKGGVILDGVFYRQWPARYYRTTRTAGKMVR